MRSYALIETKCPASQTPLHRLVYLHFAYVASQREVATQKTANFKCRPGSRGSSDVAFMPLVESPLAHPRATR
jgi:hypothetical protein